MGVGLFLLNNKKVIERNAQFYLEVPDEGLAEGLLSVEEESAAFPRIVVGLAAQDHDVPHCALRSPHGAKSSRIAAFGDAVNGQERRRRDCWANSYTE